MGARRGTLLLDTVPRKLWRSLLERNFAPIDSGEVGDCPVLNSEVSDRFGIGMDVGERNRSKTPDDRRLCSRSRLEWFVLGPTRGSQCLSVGQRERHKGEECGSEGQSPRRGEG